MADLADVEIALLATAQAALFPEGVINSAVSASAIRLYRGWPVSASLDSDLTLGVPHVTVVPRAHSSRLTTRWPIEVSYTPSACPLICVTSQNTVTFSGSTSEDVLAGVIVDQRSYSYRCQDGDTPAMVAAALATSARADMIVGVAGAVLTFPLASRVTGRAYSDYTTSTEYRRQRQGFSVILWCPDPTLRDTIGGIVDGAYAQTPFLTLDDQTLAHLRYAGTLSYDQSQDSTLYRRDLLYAVEYATTARSVAPSMLFGDMNFNSAPYIA